VNFEKYVNKLLNEDSISGGKADKYTPEKIAKKHNVPVEDILYQIAKGIKVEYEHTNGKAVAKEISMDHLVEFPDYYDRLDKMEKEAKKALKSDVKEEMVSGEVVGGSGYDRSGIAPQDNIPYAKGDARRPKALFTKTEKGKKKRKKIQIQRRPRIGM